MEEYESLTNEEKAISIRSKIKSLEYGKYSIELDILAENAVNDPNQSSLSEWQIQLSNINAKKAALQLELDKLA